MSFVIHNLSIQNFRGFDEHQFDFAPEFSAIIGNNAKGKTSILDALGICLSSIIQQLHPKKRPGGIAVTENDVRRVSFFKKDQLHVERQFPSMLKISFESWGERFTLQRGKKSDSSDINHSDFFSALRTRLDAVSRGESVEIPLFAYYLAKRGWPVFKVGENIAKPTTRFEGYQGWNNPATSLHDLLVWMKTRELIQIQESKPDTIWDLVKKAIIGCIEDADDVHFNVRRGELLLSLQNGRTLPFAMLSDGQRNMLATVADIAWRAGTLNPQLGEHALKTPGVVLIDELDLHLHPRWQRRVVEDLRRTFPNIQFIVSTHSPFIIQSLRPGQLIDLHQGDTGEYAGQSIEDISEQVMGIESPQRSQKHLKMVDAAEKYYRLIEQGKTAEDSEVAEIKQQLDELIAPYSDNPAYVAMLRTKRIAAGLDRDDGRKA